jgi:K+ transporter
MSLLKKLGTPNIVMLVLCAIIIIVAEYLFLSGEKLHGIFVGLWAPMLLGLLILFKMVGNGGK